MAAAAAPRGVPAWTRPWVQTGWRRRGAVCRSPAEAFKPTVVAQAWGIGARPGRSWLDGMDPRPARSFPAPAAAGTGGRAWTRAWLTAAAAWSLLILQRCSRMPSASAAPAAMMRLAPGKGRQRVVGLASAAALSSTRPRHMYSSWTRAACGVTTRSGLTAAHTEGHLEHSSTLLRAETASHVR